MDKEKIKVGTIRPIYNITGFQVCKNAAEEPEDSGWIPVEKQSDAEILSFVYRQGSERVEDEIEDEDEIEELKPEEELPKSKKQLKLEAEKLKLEKKIAKLKEEQEISDEDL